MTNTVDLSTSILVSGGIQAQILRCLRRLQEHEAQSNSNINSLGKFRFDLPCGSPVVHYYETIILDSNK
jgi:hypothetical protein